MIIKLLHFAIKKTTISIDSGTTFNKIKQAYGCIFTDDEQPNEIKIQQNFGDTSINYYVIKLDKDTFSEWYYYICSLNSVYQGLFFRLNFDITRPEGKLVDKNHWKYRKSTSPEAVDASEALQRYYVQDITADPAGTPEAKKTYGIGRDSTAVGIPKNTERVLGNGEYILINYTTSSNDADGKDIIKNEVLKAGDIVKTNFDLTDSEIWARNHTYSKTNQSTFGPWDGYNTKPVGMFSLGPNEQIEKREQVSVTLEAESGSKNINFYWNLNSNDEQFPSGGYVLQEGEYFYYTDENKLEMVYFGNGTQIILNNITLRKDTTKNKYFCWWYFKQRYCSYPMGTYNCWSK